VRIEDDVLVTRTGHEVLSKLTKELADCVVP
jgi:Xaa-Pro aminopeptidase